MTDDNAPIRKHLRRAREHLEAVEGARTARHRVVQIHLDNYHQTVAAPADAPLRQEGDQPHA